MKASGWLEYIKVPLIIFFSFSNLIMIERAHLLFHYVLILMAIVALGINAKLILAYIKVVKKSAVIQKVRRQNRG